VRTSGPGKDISVNACTASKSLRKLSRITLSVSFTPTDTTDYATASGPTMISVDKAMHTII
jgi:hypothetical protein